MNNVFRRKKMSNEIVGVKGIDLLMILLFSKMWVGATMILIGFVGCIILGGYSTATSLLGIVHTIRFQLHSCSIPYLL